jgi:hypothetical protein
VILFIDGAIRAENAERRFRILHFAVLPVDCVLAGTHPVLALVGVEGFLDLLVGELDDAMGIGVVKSHLSKELPPRLPDPVCEVIVSRNHSFWVAFDSVLLDHVAEFGRKDLR